MTISVPDSFIAQRTINTGDKMDFSTKYLWGITLFLVIHTILAQNGCPASVSTNAELILNYDGNCYFFSSNAITYSAANNSCGADGGYLAVIKNNATHNKLTEKADEISDITASASFWIGFQRDSPTQTTDVLGETATFTNFDSSQSSGTGQNGCVKVDLPSDSKWITDDCASNIWYNGYICQYTGSAINTRPIPGIVISLLVVFFMLK